MTTPRLPSAEELLDNLYNSEDQSADQKLIADHTRAVLEAAAEVVEEGLSVDSGDPARWTDSVIVPLVAKIRALKKDL